MPHVTRDKRNGRLPVGHDPLGFGDPLETSRAELFVLGDGAHRLQVRADICGDEWAVATHPALQVNKMIGLADGLKALLDLLALRKALVLTAGRFEGLLGLCKRSGICGRRPGSRFAGCSPALARRTCP